MPLALTGAHEEDPYLHELLAVLTRGDCGGLPADHRLTDLVRQLAETGRVALCEPPRDGLEECIRILSSAAAVLDWADDASPLAEARVAQHLQLVEEGLLHLEGLPVALPLLEPWTQLEWARLEAFRANEQRALERTAAALRHPVSARLPGLLSRILELLRGMEQPEYLLERLEQPYRPATLANWQRLLRVLDELPQLLEESSQEKVKQACTLFLADLLNPHQVFWLEPREEGEWGVVAYQGPPGFGLFSRTLLQEALEQGELVSEPQQVSPYESLVLSEARGVLIVVLPGQVGALYLSHKEFLGSYRDEELGVLRLVGHIAAHHFELQNLQQQRLEADQESYRRRQKVAEAHDKAGLGLVWMDSQGLAVEANPAFLRYHERSRPLWESLWGPDQTRARDWFRKAMQVPGTHSEVFRCNERGSMTWQAYYVDGNPEAGNHRLCVVQDLSDEHWEDCLLVLERERHWLAGDLHDGPGQVAAAEALKGESTSLPAILELMEWLRSPLYSDAVPELAFRDLVRRHLSEVSFLWNSPLAEWSPRLLLCYRLLQEVLEEISERRTSLELEWWLQPGPCWSGGLCGADCSTYQPSPCIAHRLELFQGSLRTTASGLTVDLG